MSRLTELIRQTKQRDPELGAELEKEFRSLAGRRSFGLNFERHQPEAVELPSRVVQRGDKVRVLPPRGSLSGSDPQLWLVVELNSVDGCQLAQLESVDTDEVVVRQVTVEDLVVVAEFQDPIYPGLIHTGSVRRGGNKPAHTVINGENFHVLKALSYTHRGKIDAIYIDPPYNTGAKDWKYNNDYVENDDLYRHSKWLAFMERRLRLAKDLLNPTNSVLIVTIDEKEVHRLALLMSQLFEEAQIQMVTVVTNQRGVARGKEFARVDEYALFAFFGDFGVSEFHEDYLTSTEAHSNQRVDIWNRLMRRGTDSLRVDSPNQFFPIFIDPERKQIISIGDPLAAEQDRTSVPVPDGQVAVWPIRTNGMEGRWTVSASTLRSYVKHGYVKVGSYNRQRDQWSISYLIKKDIGRLATGELVVTGRDDNGVLLIEVGEHVQRKRLPRTTWFRDRHNAGTYGTALLRSLIPGRVFPFPKSLYAVEDALRIAVGDKQDAVVLDFFAGSGTTAHAVMRLNRQDGGRRQCISVTNNEVSADEQRRLRGEGLRPGDADWERFGICDFVTKPRIEAAITGLTPEGVEVRGDYRFSDVFAMSEGFEENAEFFTLSYENPVAVSYNQAFERVAGLLWLRAGAVGSWVDVVPECGWAVVEGYGVLFDLDRSEEFVGAVLDGGVGLVFVVTDDAGRFQSVAAGLPVGVEVVRLYESYLLNFRFSGVEA